MKEQKTPPMPMLADTPREGTPSFDDLDASLSADAPEVPEVGPTPDHAKEYVAPHPLPKPTDHKTTELEAIKVSPEADPRRVPTQKNLRTLQKESALAVASAPGAVSSSTPTSDAPSPESRPSPSSPTVLPSTASYDAAPAAQRPSRGVLLFALFGLGVLVVAIIAWVARGRSNAPDAASSAATIAVAAAPAVATAERKAAPTSKAAPAVAAPKSTSPQASKPITTAPKAKPTSTSTSKPTSMEPTGLPPAVPINE